MDSQRLVLHARVHTADLHDRRAAEIVLAGLPANHPKVAHLFANMAYQGMGAWLATNLGWQMTIVKRPRRWAWVGPGQELPEVPAGLTVLPRRWIVERTLAWLSRNRRLVRDWERLPTTGETWIYLAMSRLMVKRLAQAAARLSRHPLSSTRMRHFRKGGC